MPGYGVLGPSEGTGLLPWSWAEERLTSSHDYWVTTVWPGRGPHLMPVWGVWHQGAVWFSSSVESRKIRNLERSPRCSVATDDPQEPVVMEGEARIVTDLDAIAAFARRINGKYDTNYDVGFYDPAANATVEVRPAWAMALTEEDFTGSPTRWTFGSPESG